MKLKILLCIGLLCLLTGCNIALSVYPYHTPKDVISDDRLIGSWTIISQNTSPVDTTQKNDTSFYHLQFEKEKYRDELYIFRFNIEENGEMKQCEFEATPFELKGIRYLDLYADPGDKAMNLFVIPAHLLGKYSITGDTLTLSFMDAGWIRKMNEFNRIKPSHTSTPGFLSKLIFTARTADLQRFVVKYSAEMFGEPIQYERVAKEMNQKEFINILVN